MRPVARIAQSVEQGIENPRVLGSIPSPGTNFKETSLIAGFLLSGVWTLHQTRFDYSPCKQVSPLRGRRKRRSTPLRGLSESGHHFQRNQLNSWFFAFWRLDSSSNKVRLFALQAGLTPSGPSQATFNTAARVVRVWAPSLDYS
jgi:hypothetical protein